jgi:hypothetical protein
MPATRKPAAVQAANIPAQSTPPTAAARPEPREQPPHPDVREQKEVAVSPKGDKLRPLRSDKYNQLQISADGPLPPSARLRLEDAGWKDRMEQEGIWTKQIPPRARPDEDAQQASASRQRMVLEAERFFEQLANGIRVDRQMPPLRLGTAASLDR